MNEPWNNQDAAILRAFLETSAGQKLIKRISRPTFKSAGFENVALDSKFADGVDHARTEILIAAAHNQKPKDNKTSKDLIALNKPEPRL